MRASELSALHVVDLFYETSIFFKQANDALFTSFADIKGKSRTIIPHVAGK